MLKFRWPNWLRRTEPSPLTIGIDGLSAMVGGLDVGGLYLIALPNDSAQSLLLGNAAKTALNAGRQCSIVSLDPEQYCGKISNASNLQSDGSLKLLRWLPDVAITAQTHGFRDFLYELEELEPAVESLLLIGDGQGLLTVGEPRRLAAQLREFRRWLSAWQLTAVVFVAADNSQTLTDSALNYRRFLSGFVELSQDLGRYHWQVKFWRFAGSTVIDADYQIEKDKHHERLKVVHSSQPTSGKVGDSAVYFSQDSFARHETIPENWIACSDYQAMLLNIEQMANATAILHYDRPETFILLAETVHRLRFEAGRQMRILVRERGSQLRYSQELLLNRLGANQVIYQEFAVSRLQRIVESSLGQTFSGYVEGNFQRALTEAMPAEECGYLPPAKFCEVVKNTLRKTEDVNMHHVLVRLDLLPQMAHLDVLLNCQPHRANDLVTADQTHVYIFLFACRDADIDSALSRIITQPIVDMFSGQGSWSGRWEILQVLEALMDPNRMASLVDLSLVLPTGKRGTVKPTHEMAAKSFTEIDHSLTATDSSPVSEQPESKPARTARRCVIKLKPA